LAIDGNNKVQTIFGTKILSGDGRHRQFSRFGSLKYLRFKATSAPNQTALPGGLYFSDGEAISIGRIDISTNTMHIMGGNQANRLSSNPITHFSKNDFFGAGHYKGSAANFDFDSNGLMVVGTNIAFVYQVNADLTLSTIFGGATALSAANDGDLASTFKTNVYGYYSRWARDTAGNFYIQTMDITETGGKLWRLNASDGKVFNVMGDGVNNVASADTTSTNLNTLSMSCSRTGASKMCHLDYDSANDRLIFSELTTMRYIENPGLSPTQKLGTYFTAPANIADYIFEQATGKIYYILDSGTTRHNVYCFDTTGTDPTCNNSVHFLFPSSLGDAMAANGLAKDDNGNFYRLNTKLNTIYKYTP